MSQWQVLRASRASRAALGYRVHHGPGVMVHYSTTPAAAPDSSRSFCLSREKVALQDLNRRLASYLQQVQCLEAANQKLERQIQEELDKKGPGELSELDTHLRTVSLLQHQIGESLSAQAQVKLQLLNAELTCLDLSTRYEKEQEHRGRLEAELSDLRFLGEELNVHKLPELQSLLNKHLEELMELQFQHQQDMQGCPTQVSGVAVEMQTLGSSDLIQQLEDLRECVTLLNKNQNQNECWFNTQVSVLACDSAVRSEVDQSKLETLRWTVASLEEELTQLQDLNAALEASGLEQTESFVLQLEVLQRRADNLCRDLDSVLQGTAQQAADYEALLYVKTRLETEIKDYKRLLDAMSQQRFSSLHSNSATNFPSHYASTSPSSLMTNFTVHKPASSQVKYQRINQVSRDKICTVQKTPVFGSLTEIATPGQTITDSSKHPKSLIVSSINTSNQTGSFHKSQNQTEALSEGTEREFMTTSDKINNQSIPVEDKINPEDHVPLNSGFADSQIREDFKNGAVSKIELHTSNSMLLSGKQSATSPTDQPTPAILTSNKVTTEAFKNITLQTEIIKACDSDPSKHTAAEIKEETETVVSSTMNCTEGTIQAEEKTEMFTCEQNTTEAGLQTNRTGSNIHNEIIETIPCAEPEYALIGKENNVMQDSDPVTGIALHCPDTNVHLQRRTESSDILNKVEVEVNKSEVVKSCNDINKVEMIPAEIGEEIHNPPSQEALMSTTKSTKSTSQTDSGVALSSSSTDEFLSPDEGHVFMSPSNPLPALNQEVCLSPVETEVIMSMNAQVFSPVDRDCRSPDSLLSPEDPDMVLTPNGPNTRDHNESTETIPCAEPEYALTGKENNVMQDSDSVTGIALHFPDTNADLRRRTESSDILKKVDVEVNKSEAVKSCNDINKVEMNPAEIGEEINNPPSQEALMSTTKSTKSTSRTDSGVALSSSSTDEFLSPDEGHVFISPSNPLLALNQEVCLSPVETEVIMSMNAQVFSPVDLDCRSPDSLLSPEDMFLSPNDPNTCLSPVEANLCRSPNFEDEDEEACFSPSEANMRVRPVEKYVLTTKELGPSLLFSGDQALPGEDRSSSISERDGDNLCFGSFEDNTESSLSVNSSKKNYKPNCQDIGSRSKDLEFRDPSRCSVIADKEEQLGFGGLYRKSTGNAAHPRDMDKCTGDSQDIKNILNHGGSLGGPDKQKEDPCIESEIRKQNNYNNNNTGDFGVVPANERTTFTGVMNNLNVAPYSGIASDSARLCEMAANSSGKVSNIENAAADIKGRFRKGSGEWKVYGVSTENRSRSLSSTGSEEGPSGATLPATSRPETGRFSRRGSSDYMVYGSLGRKSSLSSARKEEALLFSTSQPKTTFGSVASTTGEQTVDSSSIKQAGSDDLYNTERRESLPTALHLATSPPETGRFGSRGSGEWKFYGGSTGRISSWAGSSSLPNADDKKSPLGDIQLATNPPAIPRTGRFDVGGSGERQFYGGSTRRLSSASSTDGVSVSANYSHIISPPTSGQRLSSAGSGGRLSSGGVVRRSSSVGSGGRLSNSSGSYRTSSSGRYASTGSGEQKPVYSSSSSRRSSAGNAGLSGGVGKTNSQRASSPGGRLSGSMGSGGWLNSSTAGGNRISSPVSRPKLGSAGSSDRVSHQTGTRISSSSGSGRTSSTGGRVISSNNWPIRSTGSGAGSSKERISVCKMAALSISAAGRERSQDRRSKAQKSHQEQQAAGTSPLLQRWLSTGVGVTSVDPEGLNDVMHL